MKKILALILAALMLAAVGVSAVTAEEYKVDLAAHFQRWGNKPLYLGDEPIAAPTVLDGVISEGEYLVSRTIEKGKEPKDSGAYAADFTEHFAYDEDWFYYAIEYTMTFDHTNVYDPAIQGSGQEPLLSIQHKILPKEQTVDAINEGEWHYRGWIRVRPRDNGTDFDGITTWVDTSFYSQYGKTCPVWEQDKFVGGSRDAESDRNIVELKLSREWMMDQCGFNDYFAYNLYFGEDSSGKSIWHWFRTSNESKVELMDMGISRDIQWYFLYVYMYADPAESGETTTTVATTPMVTLPPVSATTTTAAPTTTTAFATTTAKATEATTTTAEEKDGCGSTLAVSALAIIPTLVGGVVLTSKKRKED